MAQKEPEPIGRRAYGEGACLSRDTGCGGQRHQVEYVCECEGDTALFQSEEGEPWDGRDRTIMSRRGFHPFWTRLNK